MIISLVSQKGGVGKSTLALSIAWELQARGSRVLIVDTDPQGTSRRLGELAAARRLAGPTTIVLGSGFEQPNQLPRLANSFDHIVIDTPGQLTELTKPLLEVSDIMLIPTRPSLADMWGNEDLITIVTTAKRTVCPDLHAAVVLSQTNPKTVLYKKVRDRTKKYSLPTFRAETTSRVAWQETLFSGQGVAQQSPNDRAAQELRAIVNELLALGAGTLKEVSNG